MKVHDKLNQVRSALARSKSFIEFFKGESHRRHTVEGISTEIDIALNTINAPQLRQLSFGPNEIVNHHFFNAVNAVVSAYFYDEYVDAVKHGQKLVGDEYHPDIPSFYDWPLNTVEGLEKFLDQYGQYECFIDHVCVDLAVLALKTKLASDFSGEIKKLEI